MAMAETVSSSRRCGPRRTEIIVEKTVAAEPNGFGTGREEVAG